MPPLWQYLLPLSQRRVEAGERSRLRPCVDAA